jgi:hypothetical protein
MMRPRLWAEPQSFIRQPSFAWMKKSVWSSYLTFIQDETYRTTVLDPLGKLISVFPDFEELMKKRSKKLLDYDRVRSNVKRLVEKPSNDPSKLAHAEKELNEAKAIYEGINNQLITEIQALMDLRIPYLTPSFEAIAKSQLAFNQAAFFKLDGVKTSFTKSDSGIQDIEGRAEAVLQQMRQLSICHSLEHAK